MVGLSAEREIWLARCILPLEPGLRAQLRRWRLPDDLDADDVVQECYGKLAALDSVAEIRNPRNYLYSIARTTILMHVRRSRVVSIRTVDDLDSYALAADEPSPETQVSDREQLHILAMAVARLPEPGRSAFLLRVIDELSHREIGERLGMTGNAVQKNLTKSLQFLSDLLGRGGNTNDGASIPMSLPKESSSDEHARDERRD